MSGVITLKFTSLLIRTISKPVANAIKSQSRQSPFLKRNFIRFGQFVNKIDMRLRNNANVKVRPLNDNKAIELGSNFLSELFVFSTAASLIIYESTRPKKDASPAVPVQNAPNTTPQEGQATQNAPTQAQEKSDVSQNTQKDAKSKPEIIVEPITSKQIDLGQLHTTIDQLTKEVNDLKSQNRMILSELSKLSSDKHITSHVNSHVNK